MEKQKRVRNKRHKRASIDSYAYRSGLREWNTVYKVFFTAAALVTVITADSLSLSVMTVLFMGWLSCALGRVKAKDYFRLLLAPAMFIAMSGTAVLIQLGSGEGSIWSIPVFSSRIYVTEESLWRTVRLSLKALGAVSCLYLMTLSTPMREIISVLGRLHAPKIVLELMHLIYRYIFLLFELNERQKDAVRARLGYDDRRNVFRIFGAEMANLFVISMNRARDYYDALESRGYEGNCLFWEERKAFGFRQLTWGMAYAGLAAVCLIRI